MTAGGNVPRTVKAWCKQLQAEATGTGSAGGSGMHSGSAPAPAFESKMGKKVVLGKTNSLYSQHKQENYIQASSTNGKNKSLI